MSAALQYLGLTAPDGCVELWNQARLDAYLTGAGLAPWGFEVTASPCDGLADLLADGGAAPVYTDPELDVAPWWDPHSAVASRAYRFAGLMPLEVRGLDDEAVAVDMVSLVDGTTVVTNRRDLARQITVRALLIGQDCCATRYGLEWLKQTMLDLAAVPGGVEAQYLSCCPGSATGDQGICADSTGECDPDVDEDCEEIEDCEDDYTLLPVDEWWRVLAGVSPSEPVRVVEGYGGDCGCGGAPLIEVTFGLVATVQQPWRPLVPALPAATFADAHVAPTYRFRKRKVTAANVLRTRERPERKVVLRGDKWCPVGDWGWADIQQGGGEGYVTVQEAVESVNRQWEDDDPPCGGDGRCRPRHIRLVYDEIAGSLYFETVRWTNYQWQTADPLAAIPCNCPVEVVELTRRYMAPSGNEDPPIDTTDVIAPGDGDDCCHVALQWTATTIGNWFPVAASDGNTLAPYTEWGAFGGRPARSGWPPVGCKIVVARNCPPDLPPEVDVCPESVDCQVTLNSNGTWTSPVGYDRRTFPSTECRWTVAGQITDPIAEWVQVVTPQPCTVGCADDEQDLLVDPALASTVARPPVLALPTMRRCLSATTAELRFGWGDHRQFDLAAPVVDFTAGLSDARSIEVLIWNNPALLDWTDDTSWPVFRDCNALGVWSFPWVPAGARIRIDCRTRRVTATLPGGRHMFASQLVEERQSMPTRWPLLVSCGMVGVIRAARKKIDDAATASVWVAGAGY